MGPAKIESVMAEPAVVRSLPWESLIRTLKDLRAVPAEELVGFFWKESLAPSVKLPEGMEGKLPSLAVRTYGPTLFQGEVAKRGHAVRGGLDGVRAGEASDAALVRAMVTLDSSLKTRKPF